MTRDRQIVENVIVISDNPELSIFLKREVNALLSAVRFDFKYSSVNPEPSRMVEIGATSIDLKSAEAVEWVLQKYDLVLSVHCKQIFPRNLVENVCCINFHPGFNPFNRGWYPQAFSMVNGLPLGATIHLMDAEIDHGPIIDQEQVQIEPGDTSLELYQKIVEVEKILIRRNLAKIVDGTFHSFLPKEEGNYNGIREYRELCRLDLTDEGTFEKHLNILRATTHGSYRNAYFIGADGLKYFVRILIEKEISE